ncbi:MAG: ribonuclease H-like domain-containing protein [Verrucomicrobia bacterium]|nr:ribonuclease H-like domain-containing protein [Verrucomicrobiota bacterium]
MAGRNFVYFDLETRRSANDVGGWAHKARMGMSVGVTYSSAKREYIIYPEEEASALIEEIMTADLVIGYNHVSFDYEVLMGYSTWDIAPATRSLDMMVDIEEKLGHRLKLESIASACLGAGKSADGIDAIRWWQQGEIMKIAEYCCFDVKVTKLVHEFGVENGFVRYIDRFGNVQKVDVDWEAP